MATEEALGYLTLAHDPESLRRARAMARSLRRHERDATIALLAALRPAPRPEEFDLVIEVALPEPFAASHRFFNKLLALARHAPFRRGLFLDDDVLVLGPLGATLEQHFAGRPFALNCDRRAAAEPFQGSNHVDPAAVAAAFGIGTVMDPYGGGHLYFERPGCDPFLREAVALVLHEPELYRRLSGDGFLGDEVALAIVANRHGVDMPCLDGWIDPLDLGRAESIELDLDRDRYRLPGRDRGADERTRILHFCADGKAASTYRQAVGGLLGEREGRVPGRLRALLWRAP